MTRRDRVAQALVAVTRASVSRPGLTLGLLALLTLAFGGYAATHLGVNTDNRKAILAKNILSEARAEAFEARFGGLADAILVVVEAEDAPLARDAVRALATRLEPLTDAVASVEAPAADPFYERNALLFVDLEDVEAFADEIVRVQPFLGELERSPDLATLSRLIEWGLDAPEGAPDLGSELPALLDQMSQSIRAVEAGHSVRVSWGDLMAGGFSFGAPTHQLLIVQPVLYTDQLLPATQAIDAIRAAITDLDLEAQGVRVRLTGYPVLNDEEMKGLLVDVGAAGVASFLLVLIVLWMALRSPRMVGAAAVTLLTGLVWTGAYAALTVVKLNLISVTFAVLFVGLGVDFAIHLGMHVGVALRGGHPIEGALRNAVHEIGPALALCTVSTAIGFLSFLPTDFRGVAELGIVAGGGMIVIFALTLTLFPALLAGPLRPRGVKPGLRIPFEPAHSPRSPGLVAGGAAAATVLLLVAATGVRFDANVVNLRNPETESVKTWNDLLDSGATSPWFADVLARDLDDAAQLAEQLEALPEVDRALTAHDLVPADQDEKLEILSDLAFLLDAPVAARTESAPLDATGAQQALVGLQTLLTQPALERNRGALSESSRRLRASLGPLLERLEAAPQFTPEVLAELERMLLSDLPGQLERLRESLEPEPLALADLPDSLVSRMLAPDGAARVQVHPAMDLSEDGALAVFVAGVRTVAPEAVGLPVNVVAIGEVTSRSLRQAFVLAIALITLLLFALGQRPSDVALTLTPLLLACTWTVGLMAIFDISFNFANVIVLPLLLGAGVDSGIHLVSHARRHGATGAALASSTTGRAIFFSAITTLTSFGTLATSAHRGVASLGLVLVIGMALTLVANLVVLPSLLALRERRDSTHTAHDVPEAG